MKMPSSSHNLELPSRPTPSDTQPWLVKERLQGGAGCRTSTFRKH